MSAYRKRKKYEHERCLLRLVYEGDPLPEANGTGLPVMTVCVVPGR